MQSFNQNLAQVTKFKLNFERLPLVTFFCTTVNMPGVSTSAIPHYTPFADLYIPGDKIVYQDLDVNFLIDEDFVAWQSIHDWVRGMTFPTDFKEYRDLEKLKRIPMTGSMPVDKKAQYSDAVLSVYTNQNNPHIKLKFIDVFPITLSSIEFDNASNADNILVGKAVFKFSYYDIERA
ncbi:tail completion and sheath stabilizer protein [uncultured Caudovirales phage]|uniref:Tail completion and sheath stabilizer protein n=1 Tax=uncultured Caudovirales phage TaxID=2100421 RepID=A0A6J5KSY7_9CAUD|nr:tail completion and sheath stabilizer protein [uncultured Caudovirales phage]